MESVSFKEAQSHFKEWLVADGPASDILGYSVRMSFSYSTACSLERRFQKKMKS
jgi:hypothetical protein